MAERSVIKGRTVEQQMASIDAALRRGSNRVPVHRTIILSPPIPYSAYAMEMGIGDIAFAFFFPMKGVLKDMFFKLDDTTVKDATFQVTLFSTFNRVQEFKVNTGLKVSLNWEVLAGDRIACVLQNMTATERKEVIQVMQNVWSCFSFEIDKTVMKVEEQTKEANV